MNLKTKKLVVAALMAAVTCVFTMVVKIPSPMKGYLNLGDCAVLAAGFLLSPAHGFLAAGLGSALADAFSGYFLYAPATFLIKGGMALIACFVFRGLFEKTGKLFARIVGGVLAETWMVVGYLLFESVLYGFLPSLVNVPANAAQGVAGLVLGVLFARALQRLKLF